MKSVGTWKTTLRTRLREAMVAKDRAAIDVVREVLAAIDNAEAPAVPAGATASTSADGAFAGSTAGLGAAEVARLTLSPDAVHALVEREIHERRLAAAEYTRLGRTAEADTLTQQIAVLVALAD